MLGPDDILELDAAELFVVADKTAISAAVDWLTESKSDNSSNSLTWTRFFPNILTIPFYVNVKKLNMDIWKGKSNLSSHFSRLFLMFQHKYEPIMKNQILIILSIGRDMFLLMFLLGYGMLQCLPSINTIKWQLRRRDLVYKCLQAYHLQIGIAIWNINSMTNKQLNCAS